MDIEDIYCTDNNNITDKTISIACEIAEKTSQHDISKEDLQKYGKEAQKLLKFGAIKQNTDGQYTFDIYWLINKIKSDLNLNSSTQTIDEDHLWKIGDSSQGKPLFLHVILHIGKV